MSGAIEPPANDERWQETIVATSPPGDVWSDDDIESLIYDAMATLGKSYDDAESLLDEYSPGQLRTLLDRHWTGRPNNET